MKPFQIILKKLREQQGLTQYELAVKLEMPQSNIGMYESGRRMAPPDVLIILAQYFNVSVDYLLGRDEQHSAVDYSQVPPDVQFAFANGMDGLTQDDIDDLVRLANLRRELNKSKKK